VDLNRYPLVEPVIYRRVRVHGAFDFDREILLRGRVFRGTPGIQVVTPLLLANQDTAVLVNRGFVPTPDAGPIDDRERYREPEVTDVDGIALAIPDAGDGNPIHHRGRTSWRRLDLSALRRAMPYPLARYYLVIEPPTSSSEHTVKGHSLPIRIDPPALDDGPHLAYAIQWFLIGGTAVAFGVLFILRRPVEPG
jgi:surfeit locus 1 family protein